MQKRNLDVSLLGAALVSLRNVKARMGGAQKKAPARKAKASSPATPAAGLDGILAAVKNAEQERTKMRAALEKIQAVIAGALA